MSSPAGLEVADGVRRGLLWSSLNSVVLRMGSFAIGVVLARLLTPEQFGVFAVALTVQAILMTLADFGLSTDLIRTDEPQRRAPTVGMLGLVAGGLLALAMAVSANPMAKLLGSPDSGPAIAVMSITLLLSGAGVVPYAMLLREFRQKALFGIAAVDLVISAIVTIALVSMGWGAMALAVGRVAAQSSTLVLQFVLSGLRPRYALDRQLIGSVLGFGLPVAGANLLSWVLISIDNVVIARTAGPVALGFYVLAFNVSNWPVSAMGNVVRSVALPGFSRTRRCKNDPALVSVVGLAWAMALPVGALLAALAGPVVLFVYGSKWSPSIPVLAALGVFGALRVMFDLVGAYLLARGEARVVLWLQLLWLVSLVPAIALGIRAYGIAGAGWAHVMVGALVILPAYLWAARSVGTSLRKLAGAVWMPTLAILPAAIAGWLVAAQIDEAGLALLAGATAGVLIYAVLLARWLRRALDAARSPEAPIDSRQSSSIDTPTHVMTPGGQPS